jgi:hypothetical protein
MSNDGKEEKEAFIPGLTVVSASAVIFGLVTVVPALIYLGWAVGPLGGTERFVPVFVTMLLFTEVGRLVRRYVTSQEAYIIYFMLQALGLWFIGGAMFGDFLLRYYYRSSPYTILYGLADKFPTWYVPAYESYGPLHRTFISADWTIPILISLITTVSGVMIDYGISFITNMVYIEVENLPFPVASIDVEAISTLTERTPEKMMYFSFAAVISLVYEFAVYGIPNLTSTFLGTTIVIVPYPWIDLTGTIERVLPGAIFAIGTDIANFMVGWIIPFSASVWLFIGSIAIWVFGNALALKINIPYFALWQKEWTYGAPIDWWWQRATFDLWASPQVGLALGVALAIFALGFKSMVRGISALRNLSREQLKTSYIPFSWTIGLIAAGTLIGMALSIFLVPDLWPVWVVSWLLIPFTQGVLSTRATAETGLGVTIPYIKEAALVSFTKPGDVGVWVAPFAPAPGSAIITHRVKVAKLLNVRPLDYYKAYLLFLGLAIILSFVYVSVFWIMAPIPSSFYPYASYSWPVNALNFSLWVSRSIDIFKLDVIAVTTVITFLVVILSSRLPAGFFSPIGLLVGFQTLPPFAFNYLVGALLGKWFERRMGKEKWEMRRSVMLAGTFCGIALAVALAVGIAIIGRVIISKPF